MELVSVIIPVYNVADYLSHCIDSIVNQTYENLQLILIDDGSTDKSGDICDSYAEKDQRINVIHQTNSGVSAARNKGIDFAQGRYLMFVDGDDWLELSCIQEMVSLITMNPVQIVTCRYFRNERSGAETVSREISEGVIDNDMALNCYSPYYFSSCCAKLYSANIVKSVRFSRKYFYSEDTLFYSELLFLTERLYFSNKVLYHYRINPSSAMHKFDLEKRVTDFYARKAVCDLYCNHDSVNIDGAICRTVESACLIKHMAYRYSVPLKPYKKELDNYIFHNILKYLFYHDISFADKTKKILSQSKIITKILSMNS